ncbi:MAG: hypothetical protein SGI71_05290 [Verrucomicrobiota bacterium]|nr:hypothetical protein [Verrucomicrobiota bacterium]
MSSSCAWSSYVAKSRFGIEEMEAGHSEKISSAKGLGSKLDVCLEKAIQRLDRANAEPL